MNNERLQTIEQVKQFLMGSDALDFRGVLVEEIPQLTQIALIRFKYYQLKRAEKGIIRRIDKYYAMGIVYVPELMILAKPYRELEW